MTKDYLKLHFIVFIWGFTAILGLLISIPAVELVFYRTLFTFLSLGLIMYFSSLSFRIDKIILLQVLGTGFLIALHWIMFFASARLANASVSLAGMATCSFWTSLIEPLLLRRRVRFYEVLLGLIMMGGLYVIFRFEFGNALALLVGIGAAMLSSLFTVINAKLVRKVNHYVLTFYEMLGAWLGTIVFFPAYLLWFSDVGALQLSITGMDFLYLLILAVVCTVFTFSTSIELMKRLTAFAVNLAINLEPVYGIVLAFLIFGDSEKMSAGFYWGTLIILVAVLMYPVLNRYYHKRFLSADNIH